MLAVGAGCAGDDDRSNGFIGPEGGVVVSADGVLTITIQPDALPEPTEIWIEPSSDPPQVFGPTYWVLPSIELQRPAIVTYRYFLPADLDDVAVGVIDAEDYAAGNGHWRALPLLAVDEPTQSLKARDDRLSLYYGLLDG